jgi:hypothetical protein
MAADEDCGDIAVLVAEVIVVSAPALRREEIGRDFLGMGVNRKLAPSALARLDWPDITLMGFEMRMVRPRLVAVEDGEGIVLLVCECLVAFPPLRDKDGEGTKSMVGDAPLAFPPRFSAGKDWARISTLDFEIRVARPFRTAAEEFCLSICCLLV